GAGGRSHAVVRVGAKRDRERVVPSARELHRSACQSVVQHITVDRACDRGGEGGIVVTVGFTLIVSGDGGGTRINLQGGVVRCDIVVWIRSQADGDLVIGHV